MIIDGGVELYKAWEAILRTVTCTVNKMRSCWRRDVNREVDQKSFYYFRQTERMVCWNWVLPEGKLDKISQ